MIRAFHTNWTKPYFARQGSLCTAYTIDAAELLTTALSALMWQRENGSISMLCDQIAAEYYRSRGLDFLWNGGIHAVLDEMPPAIDPICFWAAGKLYALRTFGTPCVMLDTDFIVWHNVSARLAPHKLAVIHRENIMPDIYPDADTLHTHRPFDFTIFDWTVLPTNTALSWFADAAFTNTYTQTALDFMCAASPADHHLTYMVFAEQRLLPMLAKQHGLSICSLMELPELFSSGQDWFTHIWGFKQQMHQSKHLYHEFCTRCAKRLQNTFPSAAQILCQLSELSDYFNGI